MRNATDHGEHSTRSCDEHEMSRNDAVKDGADFSIESVNAYQGALQALRDVRHMLPREGVALVDGVLRGPIFGNLVIETPVFPREPVFWEGEALAPEQENAFLEKGLLN